ncbi:MAG: hypothetical protein WB952_21250 [Terriglobales bacterium]
MSENTGLLATGARIARRNQRYIVWFYLLNLLLVWWGAATFAGQAHRILDHSLYADRLLHGMDLSALGELFARPEFGSMAASGAPATRFAVLFFVVSLLLMPGVLLGYASDHRISREEFFRSCGHNLWRFVRLLCFFVVIAGIVTGVLFGIQGGVVKAADQTSNERLPVILRLVGFIVIFLAATAIRAWFDLAQTDIVLHDQPATRKSVAAGFRVALRNWTGLLGNYILIALAAAAILVGGILLWHAIVPPSSVFGAFLISQVTLFLLLAMRFWQRATAVAFYLMHSTEASPEIQLAPAVAAPVSISQ